MTTIGMYASKTKFEGPTSLQLTMVDQSIRQQENSLTVYVFSLAFHNVDIKCITAIERIGVGAALKQRPLSADWNHTKFVHPSRSTDPGNEKTSFCRLPFQLYNMNDVEIRSTTAVEGISPKVSID